MAKHFDYDLVVIGSGTAGRTAALTAAEKGKKVAIVEARAPGGYAANSYDIPSTAAYHLSHLYSEAVDSFRLGIGSSNLRYNYQIARKWQGYLGRHLSAEVKQTLEAAGVTYYQGYAYFLNDDEISAGNERISAESFIIATGTVECSGEVAGIEKVSCLTPSTAFSTPRLPKTVFVVGAGSTGCELAEYYAELGSKVFLADLSSRILPREDLEIGETLAKHFSDHHHIKVLTETRVVAVTGDEAGKRVHFLEQGREKTVRVDAIVLATGSRPALDIGIENTSIKLEGGCLKVNQYMQTPVKHIYAVGSCLSADCSDEQAAYEGQIAGANVVKKNQAIASRKLFIHHTATSPSVASVGESEDDCLRADKKYYKAIIPLSAVTAASTQNTDIGFVKLLSDRQGIIIGGTVVCPSAELIIGEIALAVYHGLNAPALGSIPHVATSWAELVRLAARELSSHLKK